MTTRDLVTPAEFEAFLARPEHIDRRFELIHGEIVEKMPSYLHAYIITMLSYYLIAFLREHPIGQALTEARYSPPGSDSDLIPDLSFIRQERVPAPSVGAIPFFPDLAIEAQSEGQSDRFMADKAQIDLRGGSRMVWLIYPTRQIVEVLTADDRLLLTVGAGDTLTGGDVLPGFAVPVRELWPLER